MLASEWFNNSWYIKNSTNNLITFYSLSKVKKEGILQLMKLVYIKIEFLKIFMISLL